VTPYFSRAELQCRCGCRLARFQPGFLDALSELRIEFARPMNVTSACRCLRHNRTVSALAPTRSLHIGDHSTRPGHDGCAAIDIRCPDGVYKGRLFAAAWRDGWSVGWNKTFLHLDRRVDCGMPQTTFDY